ncbi:porin family protein [Larkinella soli]|uniref:porin family protein n=1 Tax=Larkinella soli TaxID=1770527 RepID=UPI000FFBC728|nr:porin family protein [Larkinella soli]
MKRPINKLLLASAVLGSLFISKANAQTTPRTGIKGGLNASTLYLNNVDDRNERIGFHVGVFTQIPVGEFFAVQPELQYTTKGVSARYNLLGYEGKNTFKLNYVELPVLATFKLGNSVDLQAGPYVSYLANAKVATDGDLGSGLRDISRENFNAFDYGVAGGLNIYFGSAFLGLRYGQGLQPVANDGGARFLLGKAKNAVGQISLGFSLR